MKQLTILFFLALLAFTACKKDMNIEPQTSETEVNSLSDIKVNDDFDWKTVQHVQVEILSNANAVLYIKSTNGDVLHKAFIGSGKVYATDVTIPSYETGINAELAGQHETGTIENGQVRITFE